MEIKVGTKIYEVCTKEIGIVTKTNDKHMDITFLDGTIRNDVSLSFVNGKVLDLYKGSLVQDAYALNIAHQRVSELKQAFEEAVEELNKYKRSRENVRKVIELLDKDQRQLEPYAKLGKNVLASAYESTSKDVKEFVWVVMNNSNLELNLSVKERE